MEFHFNYLLSDQDYLDFNLFHTFMSKSGKKQYIRLRLLTSGLFFVAGILYLLMYGFHTDGILYFSIFTLCAILTYFTCKSLLRSVVKRQIKFYRKQGKLPYSSEVTMTFTDACFIESTVTNKSEYVYSAICDAYLVNDRMFYLYTDTVRAFLLPVSAFENKAQLDAFVELIGQKAVSVTVCDFERSPYMEPFFSENANK